MTRNYEPAQKYVVEREVKEITLRDCSLEHVKYMIDNVGKLLAFDTEISATLVDLIQARRFWFSNAWYECFKWMRDESTNEVATIAVRILFWVH